MQKTEIIPGRLYLGPAYSVETLRGAGMKYIIDLTLRGYPGRRRHFPIEVRKTRPERLLKAVEIIHRRIEGGKTPLYVHCHGGKNRSVAVVAFYLSWYKGWDYDEAVQYIKSKRSHTQPNRRLVEIAKCLLKQREKKSVDFPAI